MVGLSVVLESHHSKSATKKTVSPLVVNKASAVKPPEAQPSSSRSSVGFLDACSLCRQKLLPEKDIYMYKGDKAFCSEDCRLKQMLMDEYDEEDSINTALLNNNHGNYSSLDRSHFC